MDLQNAKVYGEWLLNSKNSADFNRSAEIEEFERIVLSSSKTPSEIAWKIFQMRPDDFAKSLHDLIHSNNPGVLSQLISTLEAPVIQVSPSILERDSKYGDKRVELTRALRQAEEEQLAIRKTKLLLDNLAAQEFEERLVAFTQEVRRQTHYSVTFMYRLAAWTGIKPFTHGMSEAKAKEIFLGMISASGSTENVTVLVAEVLESWQAQLSAKLNNLGPMYALSQVLRAINDRNIDVEFISGFHRHFSKRVSSIEAEPDWTEIFSQSQTDWVAFGAYLESMKIQYVPVINRGKANRVSSSQRPAGSYVESLDARYYSVFGAER